MIPLVRSMVIVSFLVCVNACIGEMLFFDDFTDGSATDDVPVAWTLVPGYGAGTFEVVADDLVAVPTERYVLLAAGDDEYGDVSLQTRFRILEPSETGMLYFEFVARGDELKGEAYLAGIDQNGLAYVGRNVDQSIDVTQQTDLRPLEEDILMQVDVFASTLSLYAWRPSAAKPTDPLITVSDPDAFMPGLLGFDFGSVDPDSASRSVAVRYFAAADTPIEGVVPEPPASLMALSILGAFPLARRTLRTFHARRVIRRPRYGRRARRVSGMCECSERVDRF